MFGGLFAWLDFLELMMTEGPFGFFFVLLFCEIASATDV